MTLAVVALGGNLGDRLAALQSAVDALGRVPGIEVVSVSSVYETDPVGGPQQRDYLNACALVSTTLPPADLLEATQAIESALGRVRAKRWGARTLDIDIVDYAGVAAEVESLTLPHPRAFSRAFVLVPWAELLPRAVAADGRAVAAALAGVDASGVRRRADLALRLPRVDA